MAGAVVDECRRWRGGFLGATVLMEHVPLAVWPAFAVVCGLLGLMSGAIPDTAAVVGPARPPRWDLPVHMLVATVIVLGLTTAAARLAATWTGLLSPFPVFAMVLGVFTHRGQGPSAAARLLRGVVLGSLAHATMFALVASLLTRHGLLWDVQLRVHECLGCEWTRAGGCARFRRAADDWSVRQACPPWMTFSRSSPRPHRASSFGSVTRSSLG